MMTKEILQIVSELKQELHLFNINCVIKEEDEKPLKTNNIGPLPILKLLSSRGVMSQDLWLFKTLNFQILYPVVSPDLNHFLNFCETIESALSSFMGKNQKFSLKYSPKFQVSLDKTAYFCLFTFDTEEIFEAA